MNELCDKTIMFKFVDVRPVHIAHNHCVSQLLHEADVLRGDFIAGFRFVLLSLLLLLLLLLLFSLNIILLEDHSSCLMRQLYVAVQRKQSCSKSRCARAAASSRDFRVMCEARAEYTSSIFLS
jgi:hypothetical protein